MKRIVAAIVFLIPVIYFSSPKAQINDPLSTLAAINQAVASIHRVQQNPSRVVVEEEYDDIVSNLAMGNVTDDPELIQLFQNMLDVYTSNRLDAKEREMLRREYEMRVNRAFLEIKPTSHLATESAVSGVKSVFSGINAKEGLIENALNAVGSILGAGGDFIVALQENERIRQQAQGQEQEYMQQRLAGEWELDKDMIRGFNELKKSIMGAAWPLLHRYSLPDEGRITEKDLDSYYPFIAEKDAAKAIRLGKRLESTFSLYAPYWFHMGVFYLQEGDVGKARECFEKFEDVNRPIKRKDTYAAANARYKIFTLAENESEEARRLLQIIEKESLDSDWNNILFAALQNYQLGNNERAKELVQQNIDLGYDIDVNQEILRQMQAGKFDLNAVQGVAIRQFREPSELEKLAEAGNAEAQYLLGLRYKTGDGVPKDDGKAAEWFLVAAGQGNEKAYPHVVRLLEKPAQQGVAEAQYLLGLTYYNWQGVDKNLSKAVEWYTKAAEQGDADAQFNLGLAYYNGEGVGKDLSKAIEWFTKAAEQGHARAQSNLGFMYEYGEGVSKDLTKAFDLYTRAAEQDDAYAQFNLGRAYYNGEGVGKDLSKAIEWFTKAAEQGHARAQNMLGFLFKNGEGVNKDLSEAVKWYTKAAEQGNSMAQVRLALMFQMGEGVTQNYAKAVEWYLKSADQGNILAARNLGFLYVSGEGVEQDYGKAFNWFSMAAEKGEPQAQRELGTMYKEGLGVEKDLNRAILWYLRSAEQGDADAQNSLAVMYAVGHGVGEDLSKAFEWYTKAAEQGNATAQFNLGYLYESGQGVAKDKNMARMWYQKAADQGYEDAINALESL